MGPATFSTVAPAPIPNSTGCAFFAAGEYGRAMQLAVDEGNTLYVLARCGGAPTLFVSSDGGATFGAPIKPDVGSVYTDSSLRKAALLAMEAGRVVMTVPAHWVQGPSSMDGDAILQSWDGGGVWTTPQLRPYTSVYASLGSPFLNGSKTFAFGRVSGTDINYYREDNPKTTPTFTGNASTPYHRTGTSLFDRPLGDGGGQNFSHGSYSWASSPPADAAAWILSTSQTFISHISTPVGSPVMGSPIYWASSSFGMTRSFFGQSGGIFGFPWSTTKYDFFPVAALVPFSGVGRDSLSAATTAARVYVLDAVVSPGELSLYKVDETQTITPRTIPAPGATAAHHLALRDQDAVLTVWLQDGQIFASVQAF